MFDPTTLVGFHTWLSLVALAAGIVVAAGLLRGRSLPRWTALFLVTAVVTSATGFLFPFDAFLPSHWVGDLARRARARDPRALPLPARRRLGLVYAVTVTAVYLLVFVGIAQAFLKVPALRAAAPTSTEAPFAVTQLVVLVVFAALAVAAAKLFRPAPRARPTLNSAEPRLGAGSAPDATSRAADVHPTGGPIMPTITTKDGVEIFYKDWGAGQPIVFSHGWPLSADDWDAQMMFFVNQGFRVIAHDRRGHGRSSQVSDGHDMDHYADDLAALTEELDLRDAVHVGHSTGGGEVVHYIARHGESRVAKAAIISAVPPLMVKTEANPGGLPKEVFDGFQAQLAAGRSQFYYEIAAGPFYGYNRPGAKPSDAVIWNWWRQGMMGGAKAHYDGIVAFSQTDFTEDLKKITVPVLVMHGDDDQIVPYADSAPLSAKLLKNGTLKTYKGFPHGMPTTHAETINADLLAFIQGRAAGAAPVGTAAARRRRARPRNDSPVQAAARTDLKPGDRRARACIALAILSARAGP